MIQAIKNLFGNSPEVDYKELLKNGATIVDVRTPGEYQNGHIKNSINIPLDTLPSNLSKLKKDKPVITCCASGGRSGSAKGLLESNGFTEVHNGGGWASLQSKI
jgi:phage shock protein E